MMRSNNGQVSINVHKRKKEIYDLQLFYNKFLTQTPLQVYFDNVKRPLSQDYMRRIVMSPGDHTLYIKGPELSLDETCILLTAIRNEAPASEAKLSQMPGIEMKPGIHSVVVSRLEKGATSLPLPNLKNYPDEIMYSSTLVLDFDRSSIKASTQNYVELDMNFDTNTQFDYQPQLYFEDSKDRIISYIDIVGKEGTEIDKQFEVIHTNDFETGEYLAHLAIFNGDQIAEKFDE